MKKKEIFLGVFTLQDVSLYIYANPNEFGASFGYLSDKPGLRVDVGTRYNKFEDVFANAMHELMEISLRLSKGCFAPNFVEKRRDDTGKYLFVVDHVQFTEAVDHAGDVLYWLQGRLKKAWKEHQK